MMRNLRTASSFFLASSGIKNWSTVCSSVEQSVNSKVFSDSGASSSPLSFNMWLAKALTFTGSEEGFLKVTDHLSSFRPVFTRKAGPST